MVNPNRTCHPPREAWAQYLIPPDLQLGAAPRCGEVHLNNSGTWRMQRIVQSGELAHIVGTP